MATSTGQSSGHTLSAVQWLSRLASPDSGVRTALAAIYGPLTGVLDQRKALLRRVLAHFADNYGDAPVRVFRAPGRVNVRGMHVDTHGGYLNLVTHDRETVIVAAPNSRREFCFSNIARSHTSMVLKLEEWTHQQRFKRDWNAFIDDPETRTEVRRNEGEWRNYLLGSMLSAQYRFPGNPLNGMYAAVGSDLPVGAGLSSSAALCVASQCAALALNGIAFSGEMDRIVAARDAEWFTGARVGLSDPAALVLGARSSLVSVSLPPAKPAVESARRIAWPEDLALIIADSFTRRNLSGQKRLAFIRNRFAYSVALDIFVHELERLGMSHHEASSFRSLHAMEGLNPKSLLAVLRAVPVDVEIATLPHRYPLPNFSEAFEHYFGGLPDSLRPTTLSLRGPLIYGVAESERARVFIDLLSEGDYEAAGHSMTMGHAGDRIVLSSGATASHDVSDAVLDRLASTNIPITECSGVYLASTPALDTLVDTALGAGALGASLTGAGMGGSIIALCRQSNAVEVVAALRTRLASPQYASLAELREPLRQADLQFAVSENHATAAAGELILP